MFELLSTCKAALIGNIAMMLFWSIKLSHAAFSMHTVRAFCASNKADADNVHTAQQPTDSAQCSFVCLTNSRLHLHPQRSLDPK